MPVQMARDLAAPIPFLSRRCLQCPNESPACPACPDSQICSQLTRTCDTCASTQCVPIPGSGMTDNGGNGGAPGSGPDIGAIAGGVVGGVVFIILASFFIWKFCFKGKRRPALQEDYDIGSEKMSTTDPDFGIHRSARASTHTVQSMASTVLTRASNIIQIAYIPGVTNRQTASPSALVPPVPPIPSAVSGASSYRAMTPPTEDQMFFTAGDIRDSTYSGLSSFTDSNGRQSIAPSLARKSVASTIYRGEALLSPLPAPTETMVRVKAAMVNVNHGRSSPAPASPPVPLIDYAKHAQSSDGLKTVQVRMPASTDALGGHSPAGSIKAAITAKPVALNIKKRPGYGRQTTTEESVPTTQSIANAVSKAAAGADTGPPLRGPSPAGTVDSSPSSSTSDVRAHRPGHTTEAESSDEDAGPHARSRSLLLSARSPFSDDARVPSGELTPTLASVAYEGQKKTDRKREQSPFEDANAVKPRYSGTSWQSSS